MCRATIGCVFLCCLTAAAVKAGTVALQDTLVVTGRGVDPYLPQGSGLVTRVDLRDRVGAGDLASCLATVAGLQFRRFGGSGAGAAPSLRGSGPAQVRILVDGLALDDAETGLFDLTRLPLERLRRADVYRGLVPARLGGGAGAGAINLVTDKGMRGLQISGQTGSFGDRGARLAWGTGQLGNGPDLMIVAHARSIDNDYTYNDHQQTFTRTDDDTVAVRRNAQWTDRGLWATGGWSPGDWDLRAALGAYHRSGGRPGPMGAPTTEASVRLDSRDGRMSCKWREGLLAWDMSARRDEESLFDRRGEVLVGFQGTVHSVSRSLDLRLTSTSVMVERPGGRLSHVAATAGIQWRRQDFRQDYGTLVNPLRTRDTWTMFAEGNLGLAADRIQITPGWRWRRSRDDFPPLPPFYYLDTQEGAPHVERDISPSVVAVGELISGELFLSTQLSRSARQPSWVELFGHRGGLAGNRDLKSEEITSLAAGLSWQPGFWPLTLRATCFRSTGERTIVYVQNSPGTSKPLNAGASETRGLELELTGTTAGFELNGNATWQRARDTSGLKPYDGKELPYLPPVDVWVRVARSRGSWRPYVSLAWQDGNFRDRANTPAGRALARTLVGAGLEWSLRPGDRRRRLVCTVAAVNLTDNEVYDVEGYPLPGRSLHATVEVRF